MICPKSIIFEAQKGMDSIGTIPLKDLLLKTNKQTPKRKSAFCENFNSQVIQREVTAVFFCWRYFCVPHRVEYSRREVK